MEVTGENCQDDSPLTKAVKRAEQRRVYKNLLAISFSFMLTFMAFLSLQNLQSSLNVDEGIGLASLSVIYSALIISSLFFTPLIISIIGCKWSMVLCTCCYSGYAAANFHPTWYTMMPSSMLLGKPHICKMNSYTLMFTCII